MGTEQRLWNMKEQVKLCSSIGFKSTEGIFETGRAHQKVIVEHRTRRLHCQQLQAENMGPTF